jgi:hypothetical protein
VIVTASIPPSDTTEYWAGFDAFCDRYRTRQWPDPEEVMAWPVAFRRGYLAAAEAQAEAETRQWLEEQSGYNSFGDPVEY